MSNNFDHSTISQHIIIYSKSNAIALFHRSTDTHLFTTRKFVAIVFFEVMVLLSVGMLIDVDFERFDTWLAETIVVVFLIASQPYLGTSIEEFILMPLEVPIGTSNAFIKT